jgi:hypothetical protein
MKLVRYDPAEKTYIYRILNSEKKQWDAFATWYNDTIAPTPKRHEWGVRVTHHKNTIALEIDTQDPYLLWKVVS